MTNFITTLSVAILVSSTLPAAPADPAPSGTWKLGVPITTYWCGPSMTDAAAQQMAEGGWNLVWCGEKELPVAARHGLRAQLVDSLLTPTSLDDAGQRDKLDNLIARVRSHPALYDYFITDEPNATNFPALGRLVAYLRERDPAHLAYINLFPTYASNTQLGNAGDVTHAYREHLRQFVDTVRPALISYDHYQFATNGDTSQYFLNLGLIRTAALEAGVPFLNIVQACTWTPSMRVPGPDEMRYLVYTSLAYGAQGISYYVYSCPGHTGAIAAANGTPTALYAPLKMLNREFVAIASELRPLRSLAIYHAGTLPPGTSPLPTQTPFTLDPPIPSKDYVSLDRVTGVLLGCFGPAGRTASPMTHALIVNLDYRTEASVGVRGPSALEVFDASAAKWSPADGTRASLRLPPGGGKLVRIRP